MIELELDVQGFPDGGGLLRTIRAGARGVLICNYDGVWADDQCYLGVDFIAGAHGVHWITTQGAFYREFSALEALALVAE